MRHTGLDSLMNTDLVCDISISRLTLTLTLGDNEIDSKLFALQQQEQQEEQKQENPKGAKSAIAVKEMLNGCMCCVLVGQMKNALLELKEQFDPDRIIIETSGSAFPAPIAWQIRELDQGQFNLDSIVTVVDCINFKGYEGRCLLSLNLYTSNICNPSRYLLYCKNASAVYRPDSPQQV